jgi:hypothetical protein
MLSEVHVSFECFSNASILRERTRERAINGGNRRHHKMERDTEIHLFSKYDLNTVSISASFELFRTNSHEHPVAGKNHPTRQFFIAMVNRDTDGPKFS